jgi:hypothetical protein
MYSTVSGRADKPHLAIVITSEEQEHLQGDDSPYLMAKATLMGQGVSVQEMQFETICRAGFAYGVIGAEIHVFSDGTPLYLLTDWHPMPPADLTWLRELPSRMLDPRQAVVDFVGCEAEMAILAD